MWHAGTESQSCYLPTVVLVPILGVVSRRISVPSTCSSGRKYKNRTIGCVCDDHGHCALSNGNYKLKIACKQAKRDFHATKEEFQVWKLPMQIFSKYPTLQFKEDDAHTHTHSISKQIQAQFLKFMNCLVFSILFTQYKVKTTTQYFTVPKIRKIKQVQQNHKFQTMKEIQKLQD